MTKFEKGTSKVQNVKTKAIKGWKRFGVFANATALAIVAANAFKSVLPQISHDHINAWTIILTVSASLIAVTAAVIYIRFFTEDN